MDQMLWMQNIGPDALVWSLCSRHSAAKLRRREISLNQLFLPYSVGLQGLGCCYHMLWSSLRGSLCCHGLAQGFPKGAPRHTSVLWEFQKSAVRSLWGKFCPASYACPSCSSGKYCCLFLSLPFPRQQLVCYQFPTPVLPPAHSAVSRWPSRYRQSHALQPGSFPSLFPCSGAGRRGRRGGHQGMRPVGTASTAGAGLALWATDQRSAVGRQC